VEDVESLLNEDIRVIEPFHPTFTYPIFGEHEKIFGYKGLNINVSPSRIQQSCDSR